MSRSKTMAQMEEAVRWQADQEEAELRHTSEHIRRIINQSAVSLRERISRVGDPFFLRSHSGTLTTGKTTDPNGVDQEFPWGSIDTSVLEPELLKTYGIDLEVDGFFVSLDHVTFGERLNFQGYGQLDSGGTPVAFFEYDESRIGVLPYPSEPFKYTIWYLPVMPNVTGDDDILICGPAGSDEWIVWDCLWKLLARDNYPRLLQAAAMKKEELMAEILSASNHQRVNASVRLDTRRASRLKRAYRSRFWARL